MATKATKSIKGDSKRQASQTIRNVSDQEMLVDKEEEAGRPAATSAQPTAPVPDVVFPQLPVPRDEIPPAEDEPEGTGLVDPRVLRPGPTA